MYLDLETRNSNLVKKNNLTILVGTVFLKGECNRPGWSSGCDWSDITLVSIIAQSDKYYNLTLILTLP